MRRLRCKVCGRTLGMDMEGCWTARCCSCRWEAHRMKEERFTLGVTGVMLVGAVLLAAYTFIPLLFE